MSETVLQNSITSSEPQKDTHKPFKYFILSICSIPGITAVWFLMYVVRAYIALGRWPTPAQPDPKDLGFFFHHISIYLLLPIGFLCLLGMVASIIMALSQKYSIKFVGLLIAVSGVSAVLFSMFFFFDFGNFMTWFMD